MATSTDRKESPEADEFIPTRRTLLGRLRDWDDQESWREFFETYWRLIFSVCVKSGLPEEDARDVVQETILSVAKQMPDFRYDPQKGSFKAWLLQITQRRIVDHLRARPPWQARPKAGASDESGTGTTDRLPDPNTVSVESIWEEDWQRNVLEVAVKRVKRKVTARQFQIFDLAVVKEWPAKDIAETVHVSRAQVYLIKHRVSRLVQAEARQLERQMIEGRLVE